jgi:hypothetical protein
MNSPIVLNQTLIFPWDMLSWPPIISPLHLIPIFFILHPHLSKILMMMRFFHILICHCQQTLMWMCMFMTLDFYIKMPQIFLLALFTSCFHFMSIQPSQAVPHQLLQHPADTSGRLPFVLDHLLRLVTGAFYLFRCCGT